MERYLGLNNSYDTQWKGSWLGLDALLGLGEKLSLNSTVEYHWVNYSAEANWNLRSDGTSGQLQTCRERSWHGVRGCLIPIQQQSEMNISLERQKWNTYRI